MLTVEGLRSAYGHIEVLHGIDLEVTSKEIVTVRLCFGMHATLKLGDTATGSKSVQCQFDCARAH